VVVAPGGPGTSARTAVVWEVLAAAIAEASAAPGRGGAPLQVVDAGGGTGGFAVPLAEAGCTVTVVDPSPDSLAALARRADERGIADRVRGVQGDLEDLASLVDAASADLVLCHSVLEYVDDPAAAMASVARTVRPGGAVSVLAANQVAAVLHRALAGQFDDARRLLSSAQGRWGEHDPMPRRFTSGMLAELIENSGLRVVELHGVRVFADLVPSGLIDGDRGTADELLALERAAAMHPVLKDVATQLHALARRR
jgi:S-adenosylmethionine-dependent methyltransferase